MALINDRSILMFSGDLAVGASASLTGWLENSGRFGYLGSPPGYSMPKGQALVLRVKPVSNTMATNTVFTVTRTHGGVLALTTLLVTVPGGSLALQKLILSPGEEYAEDDELDLQFDNTNGNGSMYLSATIYYATYDDPP